MSQDEKEKVTAFIMNKIPADEMNEFYNIACNPRTQDEGEKATRTAIEQLVSKYAQI